MKYLKYQTKIEGKIGKEYFRSVRLLTKTEDNWNKHASNVSFELQLQHNKVVG